MDRPMVSWGQHKFSSGNESPAYRVITPDASTLQIATGAPFAAGPREGSTVVLASRLLVTPAGPPPDCRSYDLCERFVHRRCASARQRSNTAQRAGEYGDTNKSRLHGSHVST